MQTIIFMAGVLLLSWQLTGMVRRYVIRKNVLDIPNERSCHHIPTPRGGGIAFVMVFSLMAVILMRRHDISLSLFVALMGGLMVALVGWLDDKMSLPPLWRFSVHGIASIWAIYWLGLDGKWYDIHSILSVITVIWCINLYNFMDGIDGLAGMEGLFISVCAAIALGLSGYTGVSLLCALLGAAIGGFLLWNWPPAKIFMGDVGSGYLGYLFAVLALATAHAHQLSLLFWIVIASVFLCDATFTVLYRWSQGEPWYQAHRKHAYQRLIQHGFQHKTVTTGILLINVLLLFPTAMTMLFYPQWSVVIVVSWLTAFFVGWLLIGKKLPVAA